MRSELRMKPKNPTVASILALLVASALFSVLAGCAPSEPKAVATPDKTAGKDVEDNKSIMPGKGVDKDK